MKVEGSVPEALAQVTLDNHPVVRWLMADGRESATPKTSLKVSPCASDKPALM